MKDSRRKESRKKTKKKCPSVSSTLERDSKKPRGAGRRAASEWIADGFEKGCVRAMGNSTQRKNRFGG